MKTIKINWKLKISWKLSYDLKENKWLITIFDNNQWISMDSNFIQYENIDQAIKELKYEIDHAIIYKKSFSIMKYFMNKTNDLNFSWDQVYKIRNNISYFFNHELIDKVNELYDKFMIDNNIKVYQNY